jgi:hypothetical protein
LVRAFEGDVDRMPEFGSEPRVFLKHVAASAMRARVRIAGECVSGLRRHGWS